jgi:hypothetical protein
MTYGRGCLRFAVVMLSLGVATASLRGHPAQFTTLQVMVDSSGRFRAVLNLDLLAFALGEPSIDATNEEMENLLVGPRARLEQSLADADERFRREVVVRTDAGEVIPVSWTLPGMPEVEANLAKKIVPRVLMPATIGFSGSLPADARTLSVRLPYVLGDTLHVYELPNGDSSAGPVSAGDYSSAIALDLRAPGVTAWLVRFGAYVHLGFRHIIPEGFDHILFVLGLFLLSVRLGPLFWQVSAFTVAHSVTLGLSLYGVVHLPASVVEPLIAASIALIAIENLFTSELTPWRPFVVFGFGLIHGLGFAQAFVAAGLPRRDYLTGLIGFNFGVECGQLTVIAAAFLLVGWFRHRPWYRRRIVIPASILIAAVAVFWTVQRLSTLS